MLLALGDDKFAPLIEQSLSGVGVVLHVVRVADEATGVALICVADDAQNAITVAPGANSKLRGTDLPDLDGVRFLLLQLETPVRTVTEFARAARARGAKVMLNAAPARALPDELLAVIDVLVVNEDELTKLAGRGGPVADALATLRVPCAVVTLGARGCCAYENGEFFLQPAFRVDPVDTTAAGDTFCGVLAAALGSGMSLRDALRRASAAAALATTRVGAQSSIPAYDEVDALLRTHAAATHAALDDLAEYCGFTLPHSNS
jgi:ribokinase